MSTPTSELKALCLNEEEMSNEEQDSNEEMSSGQQDSNADEGVRPTSSNRRKRGQQNRRDKEKEEKTRFNDARAIPRDIRPQPSGSGSSTIGTPNVIHGPSGIPYVTSMGAPSGATITALFDNPTRVNAASASHRDDVRGPVLEFQLNSIQPIRLELRTNRGRASLACSCQDPKNPGACRHILWFYDGINDLIAQDDSETPNQSLMPSDILEKLGRYYQSISERLDRLPNALNRRIQNLGYRPTHSEDLRDLKEIIAVLDDRVLPGDLFDTTPDDPEQGAETSGRRLASYTGSGRPGQFMYELLRHDDVMRSHYERSITPVTRLAAGINNLRKRFSSIQNELNPKDTQEVNVRAAGRASAEMRRIIREFQQYMENAEANGIREDMPDEPARFAVGILQILILRWPRDILRLLTTDDATGTSLQTLFLIMSAHYIVVSLSTTSLGDSLRETLKECLEELDQYLSIRKSSEGDDPIVGFRSSMLEFVKMLPPPAKRRKQSVGSPSAGPSATRPSTAARSSTRPSASRHSNAGRSTEVSTAEPLTRRPPSGGSPSSQSGKGKKPVRQ